MCTLFDEAFVWTKATGTRRLKDLLTEGCGYPIDAWTIDKTDKIPHLEGSPGLYGDGISELYFDNVSVYPSK